MDIQKKELNDKIKTLTQAQCMRAALLFAESVRHILTDERSIKALDALESGTLQESRDVFIDALDCANKLFVENRPSYKYWAAICVVDAISVYNVFFTLATNSCVAVCAADARNADLKITTELQMEILNTQI